MKRIDYHIHSDFSNDGYSTLEDIVNAALVKNIDEIAITDHFEPTDSDPQYPFYQPEKVYKEILVLREKYADRINIKYGIELAQANRFMEISNKILSSNPYDYVLGSIHRGTKDTDFGLIDYRKGNLKEYCEDYLSQIFSLVKMNCFDCLGHFDLVKRYAGRMGIKLSLMPFEDRIMEIFKLLIHNGKGIEVNTSGLRDVVKESFPGKDILIIYQKMGGEIITIGSDAHDAQYVGAGVEDAVKMLDEVGFRYITTFKERIPTQISIDAFKK